MDHAAKPQPEDLLVRIQALEALIVDIVRRSHVAGGYPMSPLEQQIPFQRLQENPPIADNLEGQDREKVEAAVQNLLDRCKKPLSIHLAGPQRCTMKSEHR